MDYLSNNDEYQEEIEEKEEEMTEEEEREYLEYYYYHDFIDLYCKLKDISKNYQSNLFLKKGENADLFIEFILNHIQLK